MSDINNTVSSSALLSAAQVGGASNVTTFAPKPAKPVKGPKEVTQDVSAIVLDDAVRAVKESDSANWTFATSLTAMMIDALSRKAARDGLEGDKFLKQDGSKLPSGVTQSNNDVLYALQVRAVFKGLPVFLGTKAHADEIAAMPNGSMVKRKQADGSEKSAPDDRRLAKILAARNYVDSAYVHEGKMLPKSVVKADLVAGKYPGAKGKQMTSSFSTARRMSAFLMKWVWNNRRSLILGFEGKTMTADDVEQIRNIIRDTFGPTFMELESAYAAGRPAPAPRGSLFDRLTTGATFKELEKADVDTIARLARFFEQMHKQKLNRVEDAELAAGLGDDDASAPVGYEDDTDSDDAETETAATGTNG